MKKRVFLIAAMLMPLISLAQEVWPSRPITFVVP